MFGYYFALALRSLRRNPALTTLMIIAIGVGIGAGDPDPGALRGRGTGRPLDLFGMLILVFKILEYFQRCFDAIFWHEQLNTPNSALHSHAYTHDHCRYIGTLQGNPCQIRFEPHRVASDDFHGECPQCRANNGFQGSILAVVVPELQFGCRVTPCWPGPTKSAEFL